MEKVLVNENQARFEATRNAIKKDVLPEINKAIQAYKDLDLGDFTIKTLADLVSGGSATRKRYLSNVESKMRKAGIRGAALKGLVEVAEEDLADLKACKLAFNRMHLEYITLQDDKAIITPEAEEALRERFRVYISDPEAIRVFNLHNEIIDRLNEIAGILKKKYGGELPFSISDLRDLLVVCEGSTEVFSPGNVNYDFFSRNN